MNNLSFSFTSNDFLLMLQGAGITFFLTLVSGFAGSVLGFLVGWGRSLGVKWLYYPLGIYIEVIRSVPLIIQFVLFNSFLAIAGYPINPFVSGLITLSLYIAAYVAEVVMAGIHSVPPTMVRAARGLGLGYFQSFRYVVVPIGARTVLPSWTGLMLGLMKDTSLIAVLGASPPELLRASQIVITRIQEPLAILIGAGAFYFVMCHVITLAVQRYERSWTSKGKVEA
ncbi:amino acid ABC transporter permease [Defluviimonas sp. WL0024]|uniref:Amino acid ABC transporter permease n=1 Tax=Albidovulum salinarum TaxID=2984153 RepID=A0ABT2X8R7_9RHOB|nr:amino acid ABC transporter permease [Defluviimonas sp. WL0024]MCU9850347.1 amino acid ABC transporter permease [Defluviimonas sp. WL0024]